MWYVQIYRRSLGVTAGYARLSAWVLWRAFQSPAGLSFASGRFDLAKVDHRFIHALKRGGMSIYGLVSTPSRLVIYPIQDSPNVK